MRPLAGLLFAGLAVLAQPAFTKETRLWYRQPAREWVEALPIGNGRLGAMVFGGLTNERVQFNESSLWSGWPEPANDREGSFEALQQVRALLREGKRDQAGVVAKEGFLSKKGYGKPDFGAYQSFGDLRIQLHHGPGEAMDYQRALDLARGVATVDYTWASNRYHRTYFSSYPDQVIGVRYESAQPGGLDFSVQLTSLHRLVRVSASSNELTLAGRVDNGAGNPEGLPFEARVRISADSGRIHAESNAVRVVGAQRATILLGGATAYALDYPSYRGRAPDVVLHERFAALTDRPFDQIEADHIADHARLFQRLELDLGSVPMVGTPTDERIRRYRAKRDDAGLESLLFQYGRYLLIASSRPGGLPANLQGIWNDSNTPPWNGDYHLNINLQMNYWPAGPCHLSDCAEPLMRWLLDLQKPGSNTARVHYRSRGWVAHHTANVWGFTAPGADRGIHMMEAESAAFICNNVWTHYRYTQDPVFLRETAWPLLRGAAEFWIDALQEVPGGFLAVSPSYSPEHGPLTQGAYYQTMIVRDLFENVLEAGTILSEDAAFLSVVREKLGRLPPPAIGTHGQLREWMEDDLEKNVRTDRHRHVSHLFALYPGRQITPAATPEWAKAARQSLEYRGDAATGWSAGWKINLWARLRDGDRAWRLASTLLAQYVAPNLFDLHPPFQIDGDFGYSAGVAEMLLQSDGQTIELLPACPTAWKNGRVRGLCAPGGYRLDFEWNDGRVTEYRVRGERAGRVRVGANGTIETVDVRVE